MKKILAVLTMIIALTACQTTPTYNNYDKALANWTSYEDVAKWLNSKFNYSIERQRQAKGAGVARSPESLYEIGKGYSTDAAYFAKESLNKINPEYKARLIYIDNRERGNNHWATGFYVNGELYVMDYGAGPNWKEMHGVHGPYKSLPEYYHFLEMLHVPNFRVKSLYWRDLPDSFTRD